MFVSERSLIIDDGNVEINQSNGAVGTVCEVALIDVEMTNIRFLENPRNAPKYLFKSRFCAQPFID